MGGKGQSKFSYVKHELVRQLATAQIAIAALPHVLQPDSRIALLDMMAGDGEGVATEQPVLPCMPFDSESPATPMTLMQCAAILEKHDRHAEVLLCERSRKMRAALQSRFSADNRVTILNNCRHCLKIPIGYYGYALIICDPNGPRDTNVDVLKHLSSTIRKADFLLVVNEAAIFRHHGLKPPEQQKHANVIAAAATRERHVWQLEPLSWLRLLNRKHVLVSRKRFGSNAMQGRILLVTNFTQRTPPNFDHVVDAAAAMAAGRSAAPASGQPSARAAG